MSTTLVVLGSLLAGIGAVGAYYAETLARYNTGVLVVGTTLGGDREPRGWEVALHRAFMGAVGLLGVAIVLFGVGLAFGVE